MEVNFLINRLSEHRVCTSPPPGQIILAPETTVYCYKGVINVGIIAIGVDGIYFYLESISHLLDQTSSSFAKEFAIRCFIDLFSFLNDINVFVLEINSFFFLRVRNVINKCKLEYFYKESRNFE